VALIRAGKISINYETYGDGEPLLLIMGFGMPGVAWLPSLPMLTGFKCIYFDNRGTGGSDKPQGVYTIEDMADDASELLKALQIGRANVFGVSMGGMIAQELTLRHPDQVSRLVLGCTLAGGPSAKIAAPEVLESLVTGSRLMASDPEGALDIIMPLLCPREFLESHPELRSMMTAVVKMMPPTPAETLESTMAGMLQFNAYDRLPQIRCPVLIVHGDRDVLVPPENAEIIRSRITQAELFMITGAGHAFQAVDPVGVYKRIVDWLRS